MISLYDFYELINIKLLLCIWQLFLILTYFVLKNAKISNSKASQKLSKYHHHQSFSNIKKKKSNNAISKIKELNNKCFDLQQAYNAQQQNLEQLQKANYEFNQVNILYQQKLYEMENQLKQYQRLIKKYEIDISNYQQANNALSLENEKNKKNIDINQTQKLVEENNNLRLQIDILKAEKEKINNLYKALEDNFVRQSEESTFNLVDEDK